MPTSSINPGVIAKLLREGLIELIPMKSPFPIHKGGFVEHARISQAGRDRLIER